MEDTQWNARVGYRPAGIKKIQRHIENNRLPGVFSTETNFDTGIIMLGLDVTAPSAAEAATLAVAATTEATAGLNVGPAMAVDVMRWADRHEGVSLAWMGILSMGEVAELLGVTRQRAHQLAKDDPTFPKPTEVTPAGAVYEKTAVQAYAAARRASPPKTGRPRKVQAG